MGRKQGQPCFRLQAEEEGQRESGQRGGWQAGEAEAVAAGGGVGMRAPAQPTTAPVHAGPSETRERQGARGVVSRKGKQTGGDTLAHE